MLDLQEAKKVKGVRGRVTISARGVPRAVAVLHPHTLPGALKKTLKSALLHLVLPVMPFPAEAVGKGAPVGFRSRRTVGWRWKSGRRP